LGKPLFLIFDYGRMMAFDGISSGTSDLFKYWSDIFFYNFLFHNPKTYPVMKALKVQNIIAFRLMKFTDNIKFKQL
jgi:hypothetical protein